MRKLILCYIASAILQLCNFQVACLILQNNNATVQKGGISHTSMSTPFGSAQTLPRKNSTNDTDYCRSQPCVNNGTCINDTNDYTCQCQTQYTGKNCSEKVCKDKEDNCFVYGNDMCVGIYAKWARSHCAYRCGYCSDKPPCEDVLSYCGSFNPDDCLKPNYVGYMRTNCRKTCSLCDLTSLNTNGQNTGGSIQITPSTPTGGQQTPAKIDSTNRCIDKLGEQCLRYEDTSCYGAYAAWAKTNCAVRCGFCESIEPPCTDKIDYCDAYSRDTCKQDGFKFWARTTCRKFCNKCAVPTQVIIINGKTQTPMTMSTTTEKLTTTPTTTPIGSTLPILPTGADCVDKINNCINYVEESCIGIFQYWAMVHCPRRCGYCSDKLSCMDFVKGCGHLPDVCTAVEYREFAITNCRKFCNFCNSTSDLSVVPISTHSTIVPRSTKTVTMKIIDGHMGGSFWLAFPESYAYSSSAKLTVFVTSADGRSKNSIGISSPGRSIRYLAENRNPSYDLPSSFEQKENTVEQKGVMVTSNNSVALYTFISYGNQFSDVSWVPPSNKLGTSYIAVSYHPYLSHKSFISITSTMPDTTVSITLNTTGSVNYNGNTFRNGDTIQLYLTKYHSFQMSCNKDITGSKIVSNRPISVQSGVTALRIGSFGCATTGSVHLPRLNKWGKTFIIPPIETTDRYVIRVVPSEQNITVSIMSDNGTSVYQGNGSLEFNFAADVLLMLSCNMPCFVIQFPVSGTTQNVTSYMASIPAVEKYSRDYHMISPDFLPFGKHYITVMIKSDEVYGLLMNGVTIFSFNMDIKTVNGSGKMWTVLSLSVPVGFHSVTHISPYSLYAVIAYGFGHCNSYGYSVGMNI